MIRVDETDPVGEIEPSFPYRDVIVRRGVEFKDLYDIQSEIGRGKFGTVYRCKDKANGLSLAAKVVNTTKKEDRRSVEREVEIMRRLQHPRLIQLYDAIDTGKQIHVILELIEGGELFERVIDDDFVLTERSCAVFMRQICEGIEFIHAQKILHLDLKPENILCLTKEGNRIKIIDFGLARQYDPNKKLQVLFGTPEFVAPEVVNFDQIGFGTDMWSIGVICYVLLSGLSPFMGDTDIETMANVTIAKYDFDHEAFADISEDAKNFIRCLLVKEKEKRMSACQCGQHAWLARERRDKRAAGLPASTAGPRWRPSGRVTARRLSSGREELDVAKDNLRLFVERWREHPDSPYTLDIPQHAPLPRDPRDPDESGSLRCQSPVSSRGSLRSSPSDSLEAELASRGGTSSLLSVPSYNLGLERRASEGTALDKPRDPASQIVLAEEIIRLSEHLRSIAVAPNIPPEDTVTPAKVKRNGLRPATAEPVDAGEGNEIARKLSSIARRRKINGTTFFGTRSFERRTENVVASGVTNESRRSSLRDEGEAERRFSHSTSDRDPLREAGGRVGQLEMDLTPPWRRPRVKHSFGETSRDVPRISNLRDLHKNLNLDEPASTKDLLLHLLGEWEETAVSRTSTTGRKSVSVDFCGEESLERKTISSLAEYFRARQKLEESDDRNPPPAQSVHR